MYADGGERRKLPDSAEPYGRNTESTATKWENRGSIKVINFTSPSKETTSIARLSATLSSPSFPFLCAFAASVSCRFHWQMSSGEPSWRKGEEGVDFVVYFRPRRRDENRRKGGVRTGAHFLLPSRRL